MFVDSDRTTNVIEEPVESVEDLLEKVRRGDPGATSRLHQRLCRRLLPFIRRKMGRKLIARLDPDDVLQQTWSELLRVIRQRGRSICDLDLFARAIARNVIALAARRPSIHHVRLEPGGAVGSRPRREPPARSSGPQSRLLRLERAALVEEALRQLNPRQASIVRLRFFHPGARKLGFEEIGRRLGMSAAAAEKAYLRAKDRLRAYLLRRDRG